MSDFSSFLTRLNATAEGDGWIARCPAHDDSHASLRIAAGESDRLLLACRAGCKFPDVLRALGYSSAAELPSVKGAGVTVTRAASRPASPADVAALAVELDGYAAALTGPGLGAAHAWDYARDRFGLSDEDIVRLGLGYSGPVDVYNPAGHLVIPFADERGVPRGYQMRALSTADPVRWRSAKNPASGAAWSKVAFFPGAGAGDEVIICEGPSDALTAVAAGYTAVAVRGAALADSPETVVALTRMVGERWAVIVGDDDNAGREFAERVRYAVTSNGGRACSVVPAAADLNEWRTADRDGFAAAFDAAVAAAVHAAQTGADIREGYADEATFSDLGQARRVLAHIRATGSDVRYTPEAGFFLLDRGVWRADTLDKTRTLAQAAAVQVYRDAAHADDDRAASRIRKWAAHVNSSRGIDAALKELGALAGVAVDIAAFDAHEHLLAVANGVVDLRTGTLLAPSADYLLTRRVNIEYHAEAQAPRWQQFLSEVFPGDSGLPDFMRRLIGYGITGSTAEQCFAVFYGTGANGKSVLTDVLTQVFREHTTTTPFSTFEDRQSGGIPNDIAALKGARLVMASEGESGRPMAEAVLKRVTGRDMISARFMRREFFEFQPTFLLMLATNYRPQFKGQDEGLWRRVKLVPFTRYFAPHERDHRLAETLIRDEAAGILAWAVSGAADWYRSGLGDPPVVVDGTREYRETSDALAGFVGKADAEFIITGSADDFVLGQTLWDAYAEWTEAEGLPLRERWTRKTFFSSLEERGASKHKRQRGIVFTGVRKASVVRAGSEAEALSTDSPIKF